MKDKQTQYASELIAVFIEKMMSDTYSVVITGNLIPGFDLESVQSSLSELFKINREKVKLYLSGKPNVLKRSTDHQTAAKYKTKIEQLGASVELHKSSSASKQTLKASKAINTPKQASKTQKPASGQTDSRTNASPKTAARKTASHQSVIDKMLQPVNGVNLIEQGRIRQKYRMEKIQIVKVPVSLWPMVLSIVCLLFGAIDLTLSYLEILTITNSFWSPIVSVVIGGVLLKSSFEG